MYVHARVPKDTGAHKYNSMDRMHTHTRTHARASRYRFSGGRYKCCKPFATVENEIMPRVEAKD